MEELTLLGVTQVCFVDKYLITVAMFIVLRICSREAESPLLEYSIPQAANQPSHHFL